MTHKVMSVDSPGPIDTCTKSLEGMGLDYFDLYLIHVPEKRTGKFERSLLEIWADMETLVDTGRVRAIGVSNWRVSDLTEIFDTARVKPAVNQVEANPYFQQLQLLDWCKGHGVVVSAYGSLITTKPRGDAGAPPEGRGLAGGAVDNAVATAAERVARTPGQVLLRWCFQTGRVPITTTSRAERLQEYLGVFDFELSDEDVVAISTAGASEPPQSIFWPNLYASGGDANL